MVRVKQQNLTGEVGDLRRTVCSWRPRIEVNCAPYHAMLPSALPLQALPMLPAKPHTNPSITAPEVGSGLRSGATYTYRFFLPRSTTPSLFSFYRTDLSYDGGGGPPDYSTFQLAQCRLVVDSTSTSANTTSEITWNPPLVGERQKAHRAEKVFDEHILPQPDESGRRRRTQTCPVVRSASIVMISTITIVCVGFERIIQAP